MPITPLFAAIFGIMYIALSISVAKRRLKGNISLGTGGNDDLEKAIRVHGNFSEYVPFTLLLLWLLETVSLSHSLVFVLGVVFLVARIAHCIGMLNQDKLLILRKLGMVGTFGVILIASLATLWLYVPVSI